MKAASISDYRELARRRLPRFLFEYIDGGSYAEVTLGRNVADLEAVALRQRVLRDISDIDCFHPSWRGQKKISEGTWNDGFFQSYQRGN